MLFEIDNGHNFFQLKSTGNVDGVKLFDKQQIISNNFHLAFGLQTQSQRFNFKKSILKNVFLLVLFSKKNQIPGTIKKPHSPLFIVQKNINNAEHQKNTG